jgi:hypothetical protein
MKKLFLVLFLIANFVARFKAEHQILDIQGIFWQIQIFT